MPAGRTTASNRSPKAHSPTRSPTSTRCVKAGKTRIGFDAVGIDQATSYAAEKADVVLRLWQVLKPRLPAERVLAVYETLERPLLAVLAHMERRGISIDREVLSRLSGEFAQEAAGLEAEIRKIAGEDINPGSPKQLGDVLFGKLGLPGGTKTRTGQWSTGARALEDLAEQGHELPQKILDWRQVSKLKSTYTDALPGFVNPTTHRVHTSYALASTTTGRLSSSDPNLQNIPIRTENGRKIRRAFIAAPGTKLVSADYSQIELRLLAEIAAIEPLQKAFREGLDIHAMTASEMFGVPIKGMPPEIRRRAKAINFGIVYGISAFGLANQLGIPREEAGAYIKKYFERFPGIRDYIEESKAFAKKHGYVLTLFGRKCHYPEISAPNAVGALLQRARRGQCAAARQRRRHHPPRHDPHGGCAGEEEAFGADAFAGARRTGVRSAGRGSGEDAAGGQGGDGRRAAPGGLALGAAAGRGARRGQLGRRALEGKHENAVDGRRRHRSADGTGLHGAGLGIFPLSGRELHDQPDPLGLLRRRNRGRRAPHYRLGAAVNRAAGRAEPHLHCSGG